MMNVQLNMVYERLLDITRMYVYLNILCIMTCYVVVNSVAWAPHEFGLMLACASSDRSISILSSVGKE